MKTSDDEYISCEEEYARVRPVKWTANKREKRQNYRQEVVESASVAKMLKVLIQIMFMSSLISGLAIQGENKRMTR